MVYHICLGLLGVEMTPTSVQNRGGADQCLKKGPRFSFVTRIRLAGASGLGRLLGAPMSEEYSQSAPRASPRRPNRSAGECSCF